MCLEQVKEGWETMHGSQVELTLLEHGRSTDDAAKGMYCKMKCVAIQQFRKIMVRGNE